MTAIGSVKPETAERQLYKDSEVPRHNRCPFFVGLALKENSSDQFAQRYYDQLTNA